MLATRPRCCS
uniref:Uncharacterized protein n=1 Tax=Arundo donax TaxID=35708 RepID=A0A0A9AKF0_ARUDO